MVDVERQHVRSAKLIPFAAALVLAFVAGFPFATAADSGPVVTADGYVIHAPIQIMGNGGFTAANGVVQGDGSESNPFVISGWEIADAPGAGIQIRSTSAHFVIRDVYVHASVQYGVMMYQVTNGLVASSILSDNYGGVDLTSCTEIGIAENKLLDNKVGVYVTYNGNGIDVTGNEFSNSWEGLVLTYASGMTVTDNVFYKDGIGVNGYLVQHYNSHTMFGNTVNGLPIAYYKDTNGLEIADAQLGELIVANCADVSVSGLKIEHVESAIIMGFVHGAVIENCAVSQCGYQAVDISGSTDVEVRQSVISDNMVVGITASGVTDLTIRECSLTGNSNAIMVFGGTGVEVDSNTIAHNNNEVYFADVSTSALRGNTFSYNYGSTFLTECSNIIVEDNAFTYSAGGLAIGDSYSVTVQRNQFVGNGLDIFGQAASQYNTHTITDNTVNGKPLLYYKNLPELLINGGDCGQLIIASCWNVDVKNLKMDPVDYSIQVAFSDFVTIRACWVSGYDPLIIDYCTFVTVSDCRISSGVGIGIVGFSSSDVGIVGNTINSPYDYAVSLYSCTGVRIVGNKIVSPAEYGLDLEECQDVYVNGNRMGEPSFHGAMLSRNSVHGIVEFL